uniref:Cytochrome P450 n=1 Tax=Biomphalaria glabrata TaxID=6526 RepID=A0A182YW76_BIOGL
MNEITILVLIVTIALVAISLWFGRKKRNFPPCPVFTLPIIGNLLSLSGDQRSQYRKWRKKCGDIFCLYVGSKTIIVLNGYELLKEVIIKRGNEFSDRPVSSFDTMAGSVGLGVITSSGKIWKEHRAVTLNILRKFGMGKNLLAERMQEEVNHYLDHLSSYHGNPVDIRLITRTSLSNVMCAMMFGQRFDYTDAKFNTFMAYLGDLFHYFYLNSFTDFLPLLRHLPGDFFKVKLLKREMKELFQFFDVMVERIREDSTQESVISSYLEELERRRKSGEDTTMDQQNLLKFIFDMFIGSSETTPGTIYWFVLYMINFPEVQEKVFAEIKENVGTERVPTIQDKTKLHYLHAAILETQRLCSLAANSFFHTCLQDTTIQGYDIPKGAYIVPCLDSVMYDENIWGKDVMNFRPERFLDPGGHVHVPEEFVPFSLGKRICVGESFANTALVLYVSNMLQKFQFLAVDPKNPPSMDYQFGLTVLAQSYEVKIVAREN